MADVNKPKKEKKVQPPVAPQPQPTQGGQM